MSRIDREQPIRAGVEALRTRIEKLSTSRKLNEETTKASLITPLLAAIGWDPTDPEEVVYEYRRRPKDSPVDYAMLLQRTPCLFLEAKAIGENLLDPKWTNQAISYATQAGVKWVILSNGRDYHLYNAHAPVPLEGKLFKRLSITETPADELVRGLALLHKDNFVGQRIDRAWDVYRTDAQVRASIEQLFAPEGAEELAALIVKLNPGALAVNEVVASLLRAEFRLDFPSVAIETASEPVVPGKTAFADRALEAASSKIGLASLLSSGVLAPGARLSAQYRKRQLHAIVLADGRLEFEGMTFDSPSTAAASAKVSISESPPADGKLPSTNGWTFWRLHSSPGEPGPTLAELRDRCAEKSVAE